MWSVRPALVEVGREYGVVSICLQQPFHVDRVSPTFRRRQKQRSHPNSCRAGRKELRHPACSGDAAGSDDRDGNRTKHGREEVVEGGGASDVAAGFGTLRNQKTAASVGRRSSLLRRTHLPGGYGPRVVDGLYIAPVGPRIEELDDPGMSSGLSDSFEGGLKYREKVLTQSPAIIPGNLNRTRYHS